MIDHERRRRIEELCDAALDRDARERAAFVADACGPDEALRQEVEALLAHAQAAEGFLAVPMGEVAAHVLADERGVAPGSRLGAYEVLSLIGAGGMGEVYRARDARLRRDVAIKVLRAGVAGEPERLQRFEQEARAAAALNHPNILAVYDVGDHETCPYIVSELLEGTTLRERLNEGAVPVRKAVEYAVQIAHGLAAAHEKGIFHRDLKPENLFVTTDGRVKTLDFGLAKLTQADPVFEGVRALPATPPHTTPGLMLGTIGYMAPEQVRGLAADHRSDIFAFGAILYEMLSGRRAFQGDTTADTITAIVKEDPADLSTSERHIPPALARIADHCLEKSPAARFKSADDLAFALEALSAHSGATDAVVGAVAGTKRQRLAWTLAALASGVAVLTTSVLAVTYLRRQTVDLRPVTFLVSPPENTTFFTEPAFLTVSPDGTRLVFRALDRSTGVSRLWHRPLDSSSSQPLVGTEGAGLNFFWSADSRFVAFSSGGNLKRVAVAGGPPQTLSPVARGAGRADGGTWNRDGVILFSQAGLIHRVSAGGGMVTPVTKLDQSRHESAHLWPHFLPDGKRFLYFVASRKPEQQQPGIYVKTLDADDARLVVGASSNAAYVPPGYLVYAREGTLMAQSFDATRAQTTGDPVPIVAEHVEQNPHGARGAFAVSE